MNNELLIVKGHEVEAILANCEKEILERVRISYVLHHKNETKVPHSQFLRFPGNGSNRIISLPSFLGGNYNLAGLKWIASFPENIDMGIPRASAILVLNSVRDGRAQIIMEGSIISAKRTAASAVIAAQCILGNDDFESIGFVGCGFINSQIFQFFNYVGKGIRKIFIYDTNYLACENFKRKCNATNASINVCVADTAQDVVSNSLVTAFATTAPKPYFNDKGCISKGSLLLNISLRDLSADIILSANNIVDDPDHVLREETSLHVASKISGNAKFINGTIGELLTSGESKHTDDGFTVFSPFGLGILDLAVGSIVQERARDLGLGTLIPFFFPT